MKFAYKKLEPTLHGSEFSTPGTTHVLALEGGDFSIEASPHGVRFVGLSQWFQPEEGEMHLPVEEMREFMARLASAFDFAWKEQERQKKESAARRMILGG